MIDATILKSLANWLMLEKCKEVGIDPSGSYILNPRRQNGERVYTLVKDGADRPFMQVTLKKAHAPIFIY